MDTTGLADNYIFRYNSTTEKFEFIESGIWYVDGSKYTKDDTGIQQAIDDCNNAGGGRDMRLGRYGRGYGNSNCRQCGQCAR